MHYVLWWQAWDFRRDRCASSPSRGPAGDRRTSDPGYMSRKIPKLRTNKFDCVKQTEVWSRVTYAYGWAPAVYMSYTRLKTAVYFTHRIYPFETFDFFCSCIWGQSLLQRHRAPARRLMSNSATWAPSQVKLHRKMTQTRINDPDRTGIALALCWARLSSRLARHETFCRFHRSLILSIVCDGPAPMNNHDLGWVIAQKLTRGGLEEIQVVRRYI